MFKDIWHKFSKDESGKIPTNSNPVTQHNTCETWTNSNLMHYIYDIPNNTSTYNTGGIAI
jgi:hypothetical protein